jgi:hypothetical protein
MFFSWFCHLLYECILSHPGDSIFLFHSSEHFAWDSLPSLSGFILYLLEIFPPPSNLFVGSFSLLLYSTYVRVPKLAYPVSLVSLSAHSRLTCQYVM